MSVALDIANDMAEVVDNLEGVTLREADDTEHGVTYALRRVLTTSEKEASDGKYQSGDIVWHFPASSVAVEPVPGAKIIDGESNLWTILDASLATLSNRYRCVCRNLSIFAELNTLVDIEVATWSKGEGGAEEAAWASFATDVRAKIQLEPVDAETVNDNRDTLHEVRIYTETQYQLDSNYRVIGPDATEYNVTGFAAPNRIDELPYLTAEVVKWPHG